MQRVSTIVLHIEGPDQMCADVDTACRATQLTFKELYDDLEQYITDAEQRWKHVMRVKRYHTDSDGLGGYGGDQCYLEGQSPRSNSATIFSVCKPSSLCHTADNMNQK